MGVKENFFRYKKLFRLLIIWFVFTSCQTSEETTISDGASSALSQRLVPSRWSSAQIFPLSLKYGTSFEANEVSAIENSADNWSESVDNQIQFFNVSSSSIDIKANLNAYDDNELGIYKLEI